MCSFFPSFIQLYERLVINFFLFRAKSLMHAKEFLFFSSSSFGCNTTGTISLSHSNRRVTYNIIVPAYTALSAAIYMGTRRIITSLYLLIYSRACARFKFSNIYYTVNVFKQSRNITSCSALRIRTCTHSLTFECVCEQTIKK